MSWPVTLSHGAVGLRPLRQRDLGRWRELRLANRQWLEPWEATPPDPTVPAMSFRRMVRQLSQEARAGRALPFAITYQGDMVGQLSVAGIAWGSLCSGHIGYWVSQHVAGRGIAPTAVALASDYCLLTMGLHRVEVNIRPENAASLRVVAKLGLRDEGLRRHYLHIDGAWRDHRSFAVTREELAGGGLLARLAEAQSPTDGGRV
ncbi:MAG TPA: GNAT family protein [Angustibacter sp.]|nr:GNAT family protein [Angustibacter sp.]